MSLSASAGTDRDIERAVGESFVVVRGAVRSDASREHDSTAVPTRVVAIQDQSRGCAVLAGSRLAHPPRVGSNPLIPPIFIPPLASFGEQRSPEPPPSEFGNVETQQLLPVDVIDIHN